MKYCIYLLVFSITWGYALPAQSQQNLDRSDLRSYATGDVVKTPSSTEIKGSPFLNDDWMNGKVIINDGAESEDIPLRFDTHENIVQFQRNGEVYGLDPNRLDGFVIYANPQNIVFKNGFRSLTNDINEQTLLRIIEEGDHAKFVAHHHTRLYEDTPSYGSANQVNEFRSNEDHYIINEGNFYDVKLRKRHITRALSDMEEKIEQYADENNLSYRDENDVARIVVQYNEWKAE